MEIRYLILGIMVAVAFSSAAAVAFFAYGLKRSLYRDPGFTFSKLFGPLLNGRTLHFCAGCQTAHILPPLGEKEDGTVDWNAYQDDGFFQRLVHDGQVLLVLADRLAKRNGRPLMHILTSLLSPEERDHALRALAGTGEGCDPIVNALPGEPEREAFRSALERIALGSWVSPFPVAAAEFQALTNCTQLCPAPNVHEYVARLNCNEREELYAELAAAEHQDKGSAPPVAPLMRRLHALLERVPAGSLTGGADVAGPAACTASCTAASA